MVCLPLQSTDNVLQDYWLRYVQKLHKSAMTNFRYELSPLISPYSEVTSGFKH